MSSLALHVMRTVMRGVVLFAFWMLLVDNVHQPEIATGAVTAGLAAILGELVAAARNDPARPPSAMLRRIHRPLVLLFTDTFRVSAALIRTATGQRVEGRLRAVRYTATGDTPGDRGRRIATEWGSSVGSNRYAIGVDPEAGYLLIHELVPADGPLDPLELG